MSDWVDEVAKKLRKSKDGSEIYDKEFRDGNEKFIMQVDHMGVDAWPEGKNKEILKRIKPQLIPKAKHWKDKTRKESVRVSKDLADDLSDDIHSDLVDGDMEKALSKSKRLSKIKQRIKKKQKQVDGPYVNKYDKYIKQED